MEIRERSGMSAEEGDVIKKGTHSLCFNLGFFILAFVLMGIVMWLPSPEPLSRASETIPLSFEAKAVLALLLAAVVLWITEVIPFSITALLIMLLIPVFGIDSFSNVISMGFGNKIIAFL